MTEKAEEELQACAQECAQVLHTSLTEMPSGRPEISSLLAEPVVGSGIPVLDNSTRCEPHLGGLTALWCLQRHLDVSDDPRTFLPTYRHLTLSYNRAEPHHVDPLLNACNAAVICYVLWHIPLISYTVSLTIPVCNHGLECQQHVQASLWTRPYKKK